MLLNTKKELPVHNPVSFIRRLWHIHAPLTFLTGTTALLTLFFRRRRVRGPPDHRGRARLAQAG